jgi:copper transport protein
VVQVSGSLLNVGVVAESALSNTWVATVVCVLGCAYVAYGGDRLAEPATRLSGRMVLVTGAVLALGALLATGHTVTEQPRAVVTPATMLHILAASAWVGGLVLVPVTLRQRRRSGDAVGGAHIVARFSRLAGSLVAVLGVSGVALMFTHLPTLQALFSTGYGRMLLAKLLLVAVVLGIGAFNHFRLVDSVRESRGAWGTLMRTMRFEALGIGGVVVLTAVLVMLNPHG